MLRTHHSGKGKLGLPRLGFLFIGAVAVLSLVEAVRHLFPDPLEARKQTAEALMNEALREIKAEKARLGINADPLNDPNATGMIGVEYNDLTTTLGSLSSKRTSVNPRFAAIIVDMLSQAKVKAGDPVAINFSGSFPALNIAVLSAARALELRPVIISSIGASTYGANDPDMTWLDMERIVSGKGLLPYRSAAASLGGIIEERGGLDGTGIALGLESIRRNGIPLLEESGNSKVQADIECRLNIYERALGGQRLAAFVNVGGSLAALGNCLEAMKLSQGLLKAVPRSSNAARGLIFRLSERGIPVIHLLNIRKIARMYGIPIDPLPLPPASRANARQYSVLISLIGLLSLCALILTIRH